MPGAVLEPERELRGQRVIDQTQRDRRRGQEQKVLPSPAFEHPQRERDRQNLRGAKKYGQR